MCDTFNDDRAMTDIRNTVQGFITRGEVFTAAHVTASVRTQGLWAGTLSHSRGVSPVVRRLFRQGAMTGYEQRNVGSFFAYAPVGTDLAGLDLRIAQWPPRVDRASFRSTAPVDDDTDSGEESDDNTDGADDTGSSTDSSVQRVAAPASPTVRSQIPLAKVALSGGTPAVQGQQVRVEYNSEGYAQLPAAMVSAIGLQPGDGIVLEGAQLGGSVTLRKARADETSVARLQPTSGALRIRDRVLMPYSVGLDSDLVVTLLGQTLQLN